MKNIDPILKRLHKTGKTLGVGLALSLIGLTLILISTRFGPRPDSLPSSFFVLEFSSIFMCVLLSSASFFLTRRFYKNAERQRIAILQGNVSGKIAEEQPKASTLSLVLPVTLEVHSNWLFIVSFVILPMCIVLTLASLGAYYFFLRDILLFSKHANVLFATIGGAILFLLLVLGIGILLSIRRTRQYIQVDEQGIQSRFLGQKSNLRWDEIKLFALWGGRSRSGRAYEVAGMNGLVRWTVPVKYRWYTPLIPTLPFEEYDKQMQAVLALIAAKTQLPLYDLRLNQWGGIPK